MHNRNSDTEQLQKCTLLLALSRVRWLRWEFYYLILRPWACLRRCAVRVSSAHLGDFYYCELMSDRDRTSATGLIGIGGTALHMPDSWLLRRIPPYGQLLLDRAARAGIRLDSAAGSEELNPRRRAIVWRAAPGRTQLPLRQAVPKTPERLDGNSVGKCAQGQANVDTL
ncbi:hypothetical protein EXIGLDRAFT_255759 [Exidia glandulosa HHB12029]|uniref:Uncharacterized protein n=1 Tax=Exidia glandulosa HHB12029 TaxID=1314781 RepID=A0A165DVP2_EXIGL|nr:hypothetical protein EXIGLDRAFT_255759 [Exidia glandulosa HHB12029]